MRATHDEHETAAREPQPADERGAVLVAYAHATIAHRLGGELPVAPAGAWYHEPGATFVTLYRGDTLHGCMGSLEVRNPLVEDVRHNALSAAFLDPRARPLAPAHLAELAVEISHLSELEGFEVADESDLYATLRPGVDGLVLYYGGRRATFLPQVWESLPEPEDFLTALRRKAGLAPDFWSEDMRFERYTVRKYTAAAPRP